MAKVKTSTTNGQSLLPGSSGLVQEKHVLKLDKQRQPVAPPPSKLSMRIAHLQPGHEMEIRQDGSVASEQSGPNRETSFDYGPWAMR